MERDHIDIGFLAVGRRGAARVLLPRAAVTADERWRNSVNTTLAEAVTAAPGAPRNGFRPSSRSRVRIAVGTLLSTGRRRRRAAGVLHCRPAGRRPPSRPRSAGGRATRRRRSSFDRVVHRPVARRRQSRSTSPAWSASTRRCASSPAACWRRVCCKPGALVAPGSAVVAVTIPSGELPSGLRERSQVQIVIPDVGDDAPVASSRRSCRRAAASARLGHWSAVDLLRSVRGRRRRCRQRGPSPSGLARPRRSTCPEPHRERSSPWSATVAPLQHWAWRRLAVR